MGERGGVEQLKAEDSGETGALLHVRSDLLQPDGGGSAGIWESPAPGQLPAPLTPEIMSLVLSELPLGTSSAVSNCYECLKQGRFASSEFLGLLRSVSAQSPSLERVFAASAGSSAAHGFSPAFKVEPGTPSQPIPATLIDSELHAPASVVCPVAAGHGALPTDTSSNSHVQSTQPNWGLSSASGRRLEARHRQLRKYEGSTEISRWSAFLVDVTRRLANQLPSAAKGQLLHAVRQYTCADVTPEWLAESIQQLVDTYGIVIPNDDIAQIGLGSSRAGASNALLKRPAGGRQQQASAPKKSRPAKTTTPRGNKAGSGAVKRDGQDEKTGSPSGCGSGSDNTGSRGSGTDYTGSHSSDYSASTSGSPEAGAEDLGVTQRGKGRSVGMGARHAATVSSTALPDCPMSLYLTDRMRSGGVTDEGLSVKVLSHCVSRKGRVNMHSKAVFVLRKHEGGGEMPIMGMYVHEFQASPQAEIPAGGQNASTRPPRTQQGSSLAGRAYIECVDSMPILRSELREQRQKVLLAMMHGYIEILRDRGFTKLHLRVPMAQEAQTHIFNERNARVRLEAMVRMSVWYSKVLEAARTRGIISAVDSSTHILALDDFPATVLPSSIASQELKTDMKSSWSGDIKAEALAATHPRLFCAELNTSSHPTVSATAGASPPVHPGFTQADLTPVTGTNIASDREVMLRILREQGLGFSSVPDAVQATNFILRQLTAEIGSHAEPLSSANRTANRQAGAGTRTARGAGGAQKSKKPRVDAFAVGGVANGGVNRAAHDQIDSSPASGTHATSSPMLAFFSQRLSPVRCSPRWRAFLSSPPLPPSPLSLSIDMPHNFVHVSSRLQLLRSPGGQMATPTFGTPTLATPGLQATKFESEMGANDSPIVRFSSSKEHRMPALGALSEAFSHQDSDEWPEPSDGGCLFADSFFCP